MAFDSISFIRICTPLLLRVSLRSSKRNFMIKETSTFGNRTHTKHNNHLPDHLVVIYLLSPAPAPAPPLKLKQYL